MKPSFLKIETTISENQEAWQFVDVEGLIDEKICHSDDDLRVSAGTELLPATGRNPVSTLYSTVRVLWMTRRGGGSSVVIFCATRTLRMI